MGDAMEEAIGEAEPSIIGESDVIGDPIGELIGEDVLEPVLDAGCVAEEEWQPARVSAMAAAPSGASMIVVRRYAWAWPFREVVGPVRHRSLRCARR